MASAKLKSDVWNYFEITSDDSPVARCKFCRKLISRGGKSHTTSNLNKHLKTYHIADVNKSKKRNLELTVDVDSPTVEGPVESEIGTNLSETLSIGEDVSLSDMEVSPTPRPTSSCSSSSMSTDRYSPLGLVSPQPGSSSQPQPHSIEQSPIRKPKSVQPTLTEMIVKKTKYKNTDIKAKAITQKISEMICLDNQPLSVVEDVGFCRLINFMDPRYEIPKRKYFSTNELPRLYEKTRSTISNLLKDADHISITTDLWTSSANDDYLAVTAHYFDRTFSWKHLCLEVIPFPEVSHTGEAISTFLNTVLEAWSIKNKLHVIVRDNGRNMVAAMTCGGFYGIPCLAHTLQLVVKDGVLYQRNIANLCAVSRKIVGHFKHSSKANKILQSAQQTLGLKKHKLVQDEPTRWNSTKHMLSRLLEQRRAISFAAPELNIPVELSSNDWELMSNVDKILKIFDDATFQCSSSHTSISEVIPIINSAMKELENFKTVSGLKSMAIELIASLKTRYCDVEEVSAYTLATLLDPRLKGTVFLDTEKLESAKALLLREAKDEQERLQLPPPSSASLSMAPSKSDKLKNKMWDRYSVLIKSSEKSSPSGGQYSAERETAHYFTEGLSKSDIDVGTFWMQERVTYPCLASLAKKYLSAPPATVFSERLFSTSGTISDKKRNRLDPQRVKMLVFLNRNLKYNADF